MSFGEKVRMLREIAELTQGQLGEKLGMTQRRVSYIENDRYEPSLADIFEICTFFNVSSDYLIGLPNNMPYIER